MKRGEKRRHRRGESQSQRNGEKAKKGGEGGGIVTAKAAYVAAK